MPKSAHLGVINKVFHQMAELAGTLHSNGIMRMQLALFHLLLNSYGNGFFLQCFSII